MTKRYDLKDKVNYLLNFNEKLESDKHSYKNWYDSTGVENFEKARISTERAQKYLKRGFDLASAGNPTQFRPVNKLIYIVLGVAVTVPMSFYYLRGLIQGVMGYNKYTSHNKH